MKLESLQTECTKTKQELDLERGKIDRLHMQQTAAKESQDKFKHKMQVRTSKYILYGIIIYFTTESFKGKNLYY